MTLWLFGDLQESRAQVARRCHRHHRTISWQVKHTLQPRIQTGRHQLRRRKRTRISWVAVSEIELAEVPGSDIRCSALGPDARPSILQKQQSRQSPCLARGAAGNLVALGWHLDYKSILERLVWQIALRQLKRTDTRKEQTFCFVST
jgi:hypothetical protein